MTNEQKMLVDWLASEEWRLKKDTALEIPAAVIKALKSFLAAEQADAEELVLYQATLSTIFGSYQKLVHANKELLSDALIKLGTFSKEKFGVPHSFFERVT